MGVCPGQWALPRSEFKEHLDNSTLRRRVWVMLSGARSWTQWPLWLPSKGDIRCFYDSFVCSIPLIAWFAVESALSSQ